LNRLLPVLERVRSRVPIPISVDTRKGLVAKEAIAAGADLINDMSSLEDPEMARVAAETAAPIVLMHSRGPLGSMQQDIHFDDLIAEIRSELARSVELAEAAGVGPEKIIVDPGIGFGKTRQQNLEILRNLDQISNLGNPVLVGASRKSFIGEITETPPSDRLAGSLAAVGWAARFRTAIVRVHDVEPTVHFLKVWDAIATAKKAGP